MNQPRAPRPTTGPSTLLPPTPEPPDRTPERPISRSSTSTVRQQPASFRPRSRDRNRVFVLDGGEEKYVDATALLARHRADGVIRIHASDHARLPAHQRVLSHFNLQRSGHRVGRLYLLPKIVRSGYLRANGDEQLPLLDFTDCRRARCIEAGEHLSYDDLTDDHLRDSFPHLRTVEALQNAILERYRTSMPDLSDAEIIAMGVGHTRLRLE